MIGTLRKFFAFADPANRLLLRTSILLEVLRSLFLALKITALYLIIQGSLSGMLDGRTVLIASLLVVAGVLGAAICYHGSSMRQTVAGYHTAAGKRIEIAEHLRYLPMGYFNANSIGSITSVTTNTMEQMGDVATRVIMLTTEGLISSLLIACFLLFFDWRVGVTAFSGIALFLWVNRMLQHQAAAPSQKKISVDASLVERVLEYIQGIAEVKSYRLEGRIRRRLHQTIDDASRTNMDMERMANRFIPVQNIVVKLTGVVVCAVSLACTLQGTMDMAVCIVMLIASFLLFSALEKAGSFSSLLRIVDLSVDRANEILALPSMDIQGSDIPVAKHDIVVDDITFSYERKPVINGISLKIPDHTTTAFVGPSGGGKTTLCHLIARFWDVDRGKVLLDNHDIRSFSMDSLMEHFSFVFQNVYLFHDTITENIRFGKPNATMDEVIAAAKQACCHSFISALPNGYETVIGEGGATLSGGERQRISIARAIMKDAPVIILDEATANVDPENERDLMTAVQALTRNKTILMIAHRLQTVRNADQICVIDQGRVVQQGTHQSLSAEEGLYRDFLHAREEAVSWKILEGKKGKKEK
jgi:ATP-binding cassette subfamily B protein